MLFCISSVLGGIANIAHIRTKFYFMLQNSCAKDISSAAGDVASCSWARHFTLTVPLSTQVYKSVPANSMLGKPCDGLASHPGGVEILLVASCYWNRVKLRPDWPLGSLHTLPLPFTCLVCCFHVVGTWCVPSISWEWQYVVLCDQWPGQAEQHVSL